MFVNVSDDGWFGGSGAPEQHLAMARVRAVENRRWLLRDTNNGIGLRGSAYGRIVARMAANIRGELDAPYGFRTDLTPYARWGDWLSWLCILIALMLLLTAAKRGCRAQGNASRFNRTHMVIEDLQRRQDELQKRIELVRSYL